MTYTLTEEEYNALKVNQEEMKRKLLKRFTERLEVLMKECREKISLHDPYGDNREFSLIKALSKTVEEFKKEVIV
jgi:DNA-binding ferritin-like protein